MILLGYSTCATSRIPLALDRGFQPAPQPSSLHPRFSKRRHLRLAWAAEQADSRASAPAGRSDQPESEAVAAFLRQHGLDPEQLQRQQPEAFRHLTLPLAEVLARAHEACSADSGSSNVWCAAPAELLARVCLLSSESGLSSADIAELWRQEPHFFRFKPGGARHTISTIASVTAWLRGMGLSEAEVSTVWRSQMRMFVFPAPTLQHNLAALMRHCPLSPQQQRAFLAASGRLLTADFQALKCRVDSIAAAAPGAEPYLGALLGQSSASELCQDLDALLGKVAYLRRYGFSKQQLSQVVGADPMVLGVPLETGMRPNLDILEGTLGGRSEAVLAICALPALLGAAPGTIAENVEAMRAVGLSDDAIRQHARGAPHLLLAEGLPPADVQSMVQAG